jgi:hypothetical protein
VGSAARTLMMGLHPFLELVCPHCGYYHFPPDLDQLGDYHCQNPNCPTHPLVRPLIFIMFEAAQKWEAEHPSDG